MGNYTVDGAKKIDDYQDIDSRCVVKFRPADDLQDDWKGEYGFDWFREGDYMEKDSNDVHNKQSHYKNDHLIGKYGYTDSYGFFISIDPHDTDSVPSGITIDIDENQIEQIDNSQEVVNADSYAKRYYSPIPIKTPILNQMVNLMTNGVKSNKDSKYYVPSISHRYGDNTKNEEVTVKLIIHAENILVIDFFVDEGTKGVELKPRSIVLDGDYDKDDKKLTITFTKDFEYNSGDVSIGVLATHKSGSFSSKLKQSFAGRLNVVKYVQKRVKVVIVPILSRRNSGIDITEQNNKINKEIDNLKRFFSQAQIIPDISEIRIKKTKSLEKIEKLIRAATYWKIENGYEIRNEPQVVYTITLFDVLDSVTNSIVYPRGSSLHEQFELLFKDEENLSQEIEDAYKVFYVFDDGMAYGQAAGFPDQTPKPPKNVIVFNHPHDETTSHELFHRLGLRHSFSNENTYTFKQYKTSDIMEWSGCYKRISLWRWQWDIIRSAEGMEDVRSLNTYDIVSNDR